MSDKITETAIDSIIIGERKRTRFLNIENLAESIERIGLLTPIVLDEHNNLIAGQRRIEAYKKLGKSTIPSRRISVADILDAEIDENIQREQFCISEKVAIADALREKLGERRGKNDKVVKNQGVENPDNCPDLGTDTRDFIADRSGLGSSRIYRQAKSVLENAISEVIEAMNDGIISVNCAHRISQVKKSKQLTMLNESKEDPGTEGSLLNDAANGRRRAKRKKRFGVPDSPDADPIYNVIRIAPNWSEELLSDIQAINVASYTVPVGIVLVECPMENISDALECLEAWGFSYGGLITSYDSKANVKEAEHLRFVISRPWHIVIGFKDAEICGASISKIPAVFNSRHPQGYLEDIIARLTPDKKDTRLDMSATEPRKGWKVWKLDYKTKE